MHSCIRTCWGCRLSWGCCPSKRKKCITKRQRHRATAAQWGSEANMNGIETEKVRMPQPSHAHSYSKQTCKTSFFFSLFNNQRNKIFCLQLSLYWFIINNPRNGKQQHNNSRQGCSATDYFKYRRRTCSVTITHSPITLANLESINLVFIFRCSSSTTNPVYVRRVNSLVLVSSLS